MNDSDISQEEFTLVTNQKHNYLRLKEITRTKDSQKSGIETNRLIEHGKRIGIDEKLKQVLRKNLKLKTEV